MHRHGSPVQTKWRVELKMAPKLAPRASKWEPLPESASTMQVTTVYGFDNHTIKPEDLPKGELEKCVRFIEQSNKTLETENTVIEMYLLRMDPATLLRMDQVLEVAAMAMQRGVEKTQSATEPIGTSLSVIRSRSVDPELSLSSRSERSATFTRSFTQAVAYGNKLAILMMADKGPKVQPAHKIEIVNREIEELRNALEEFRQDNRHSNYILRCRNEELKSRLQEINDSRAYFEDKLLPEGTDPLTGKLPGEKFIRYLEVKFQAEESEMEKLRMKTSAARSQLKRVQQQLAQRAQLGEVLHAIDFEQLRIENKGCQERFNEKIVHLIDIKKVNGRCGTTLNFNLRKLQEQISRLGDLQKSIDMKQRVIDQLKMDEEKVNKEVVAANRAVEKIKKLMSTYSVPDVYDYILQKADMLDLKKEIKICERKLKLRDLALSAQASKLRAKMEPMLLRGRSSKKFSEGNIFGRTKSLI